MTVTIQGKPTLYLEDPVLLRLGFSFARRLQLATPSPPWDSVMLGLSTQMHDFLLVTFAQGQAGVAVPFPLEIIQRDEEVFFGGLPEFLLFLNAKYQASVANAVYDHSLPDGLGC